MCDICCSKFNVNFIVQPQARQMSEPLTTDGQQKHNKNRRKGIAATVWSHSY
jgi:hypothetical protein